MYWNVFGMKIRFFEEMLMLKSKILRIKILSNKAEDPDSLEKMRRKRKKKSLSQNETMAYES